jgi:hypothetical protein
MFHKYQHSTTNSGLPRKPAAPRQDARGQPATDNQQLLFVRRLRRFAQIPNRLQATVYRQPPSSSRGDAGTQRFIRRHLASRKDNTGLLQSLFCQVSSPDPDSPDPGSASEKSRSIWDQQAMPRSWGTIILTCQSDGFSMPNSFRRCLRQAGPPGSIRRHSSGRWS